MSDDDRRLEAVARAARRLLPQLTERLARYGLTEIEVRDAGLRLRVSGPPPGSTPARPGAEVRQGAGDAPAAAASGARKADDAREDGAATLAVPSPGVGYFVYAEGLGPGLAVDKGQALGWVEVLGVRHDVRAPRTGTVRHLVAESGEPVEYGQVVIELEPAEARR
jgi:acetyl-CoA carboxylase biotin carboxyl carrier protein